MIDGEIKETASHIADAPYDPTCLNEYFRSHPVSMGVSSRGITFEDVPTSYDPKDKTEDYWFGTSSARAGRGSKVETLPCGQGLGEETDLEYFQMKVMRGLGLSLPTELAEATAKPYIDFTSISSLNPLSNDGSSRFTTNTWVGVDMAKYEAATTPEEDVEINRMAKEISDSIDKQIIDDLVCAAAKVEDAGVNNNDLSWNTVPTFGWTHEVTKWDNPFGATITTNNQPPVWINPYAANIATMEEISFTEDELDELIDLIHDCKSEVMKFK